MHSPIVTSCLSSCYWSTSVCSWYYWLTTECKVLFNLCKRLFHLFLCNIILPLNKNMLNFFLTCSFLIITIKYLIRAAWILLPSLPPHYPGLLQTIVKLPLSLKISNFVPPWVFILEHLLLLYKYFGMCCSLLKK